MVNDLKAGTNNLKEYPVRRTLFTEIVYTGIKRQTEDKQCFSHCNYANEEDQLLKLLIISKILQDKFPPAGTCASGPALFGYNSLPALLSFRFMYLADLQPDIWNKRLFILFCIN
jgi:hypothetical protein